MKHWVKVWISKTIHNPEFQLLSPEAKLTYFSAHAMAGYCDAGGLLVHGGEPLSPKNIELLTGIGAKKQSLALNELQLKGFFLTHGNGTIEIIGWEDQQSSKEAGKKHRQRHGSSRDCPPEMDVLSPGLSPGLSPPQKYTDTLRDTSSLRSSDPSGPSSLPKKAEAEWVGPLRDRVRSLLPNRLRELSLGDRLCLGEYAAFRWANYTKDDRANKRQGKNFAAQIASISCLKRFEELTVEQFCSAAQRYWRATNEEPMRSLWHVQTALENAE